MRQRGIGARVLGVGLVMLGGVAGSIPAGFAATPWPVNASGANARFGWSQGEYNTGRFGWPDVDVAGFHFVHPDNFKAWKPGTTAAGDFVDVRVNVDNATGGPADPLPTIIIREWGRWYGSSLTNPPSNRDVLVSMSTSLTGVRPSAGAGPVHGSGQVVTTYYPVDTQLGYGTWTSEYVYIPNPLNPPPEDQPWIEVVITVTNNVYALKNNTWIQKDGAEILIPEPASLALVLAGLGSLILRRSHR